LLLHGFAGTPSEVRELAEDLGSHGYDVAAPLLAGHGTSPYLMRCSRWTDWLGSAEQALGQLQEDCQEVFVGGQSMGASLALLLAARHPEIRGVLAVAAMGSARFFKDPRLRLIWGLKYLVRWHTPGGDVDLGDPGRISALHNYRRRPTVCLESLMNMVSQLERSLPLVQAPALLVHGRNDRTVPVENAEYILQRLGSRDKQLLWMERSGHAVTVDLERNELNGAVRRWLDSH
jgi:carboxylesterase